ncbi:hypothetical protein Tco_0963219 [Tanacetum coccineum]
MGMGVPSGNVDLAANLVGCSILVLRLDDVAFKEQYGRLFRFRDSKLISVPLNLDILPFGDSPRTERAYGPPWSLDVCGEWECFGFQSTLLPSLWKIFPLRAFLFRDRGVLLGDTEFLNLSAILLQLGVLFDGIVQE